MSTETRSLVSAESSALDRASGALGALALALVVAGVVAFHPAVAVGAPVAGIALYRLIGAGFVVLGAGLAGVGLATSAGLLEADPRPTPGLVTGVVFGLLGFVVAGLVASQTLGLSTVWPVVAAPAGLGVGVGTVLVREDLGATLPAGGFGLLVGLVVLAGVLGPGWQWTPGGLSATFTAGVAVPFLSVVAGLVCAWTAARAFGGFGTRGRQAGAYLLVGINAAWMVALLVGLIAFVAARGFGPMTRGIRFGLFLRPYTWFYFPPIEEYVIVNGPVLWFYWPFVMEGVALTNPINGVLPAIVGTFWVVLGAVVFAVPLGVGAAVFLTEYAEQGRFTQVVEIATNGLWSTPSIVYGLFGLAFLVPRLGNTTSLLSGQLVLGFMLLPLVVITSREALKSVPDEYRDASAALGVGKWETIKSVVLPAAMPGVITGVILGVGRIAGETAPILLVMVNDPFPSDPVSVLGSFRFTATPPFVTNPALLQSSSALPYQLFATITAGLEGSEIDPWATALVLLLVVLSFYAVGIASRIYFRRRLNE